MTINDEEMYDYFEKLVYEEDVFAQKGWKKEIDGLWYGLTDYQVRTIYGSKRLLYGEQDADRQIRLLQTMQKFLHEYIGIEGLEELLVNNYGTIENSIFFEHDNQGKPANIREHSKHQMKNAYLGSVLLLEFGFLKNVAETIAREQSYVTSYLVEQAHRTVGETENVLSKLEELAYKIILLSALFHDIGYPMEYHLRSAQEISDYPPHLKILTPAVKTEFSEMKVYLLESQLFKQVSHEKIAEKYRNHDHGALSALSLLMHFYYSGRIYSLPNEKRCLIEMTAIAVYHHTDRFTEAERMVYVQDPISYMVRLCDDLQEWERFKLRINNKHNYLLCSACGKILQEKDKEYTCPGCGQKYYKVTQIENRKVNYVCLCDGLEISESYGKIKIHFQFHLMKQMEILLDDYCAVIKSNADIIKIVTMTQNQGMRPKLELEWYVSNNPLCLIDRMLEISGKAAEVEKWMKEQKGTKRGKNLWDFYQDFNLKRGTDIFGEELETDVLKYEESVQEYVRKYYGEIYCLYQFLFEENTKVLL
ncbi:MAG: hypothetical protein NC331_01865 [Lachnospiraceae bacterium]|nr:hypothetical protein [Lachnospiraceae bacterium]MCM1238113.1 hypothetical protein [Lachnospiraceae bacterium]